MPELFISSLSFPSASSVNVLILNSHLQALPNTSSFLKCNESNSPSKLNPSELATHNRIVPNPKWYCVEWAQWIFTFLWQWLHPLWQTDEIKIMWMAFKLTIASFLSVYNATSMNTLDTARKEYMYSMSNNVVSNKCSFRNENIFHLCGWFVFWNKYCTAQYTAIWNQCTFHRVLRELNSKYFFDSL